MAQTTNGGTDGWGIFRDILEFGVGLIDGITNPGSTDSGTGTGGNYSAGFLSNPLVTVGIAVAALFILLKLVNPR